jgi:hypothetical protein
MLTFTASSGVQDKPAVTGQIRPLQLLAFDSANYPATLPGYTTENYDDGIDNSDTMKRYQTGWGNTPTAAFANAASEAYGIFLQRDLLFQSAHKACPAGMTVDTNMGVCGGVWRKSVSDPSDDTSTLGSPCVGIGTDCNVYYNDGFVWSSVPGDTCQKPKRPDSATLPASTYDEFITGLCVDTTGPYYDGGSQTGKTLSVGYRDVVANWAQSTGTDYVGIEWNTHRFVNNAAVAVQTFKPSLAQGAVGQDWATPAIDGTVEADSKVLLWGRPNFIGYGAGFGGTAVRGSTNGRSDKLYFAYATMPQLAGVRFTWSVNYFTGLNASNVPQFSTDESKAKALDLTGGTDKSAEQLDIVNQMSVAWVPQISRFVMIYGGDGADSFLELVAGPNWRNMQRNGDDGNRTTINSRGGMYVRFSSYPWGPWTAPVPLGGSADTGLVTRWSVWSSSYYDSYNITASGLATEHLNESGGGYGVGGVLHGTGTSNCATNSCMPGEAHYDALPRISDRAGHLYGASIVSLWTKANGANADVYWLASTWAPYSVVLMKSTLNP